jgi:hypothetical protein
MRFKDEADPITLSSVPLHVDVLALETKPGLFSREKIVMTDIDGLIDIVEYHFTLFRLRLKFRKIRKELEEMFYSMKTNPQVLNSPKNLPFYSKLNENIAEMLEVVSENEKLANTSLLRELNKLKRVSYSSEAYVRRHSVKQS